MFSILKTVGDIAIGASPWVPWDQHCGLRSIDGPMLRNALAGSVPDADVLTFSMVRDRATTDRARLTLEWNEAGRHAGLPTTVFAKGTPSLAASRVLNSAFGLCATEVHFYNNAYPEVADITLRPYFASVSSGGRFLLVLESKDAADTHFYTLDDEASLDHAEAIVDSLAKLHGRFYNSARFNGDLSWVTRYRDRPGQRLAPKVMAFAEKRFLKKYDVPTPVARLTRFHLANRDVFWRIWESMPPTLCHGDTHIGNTFRTADGFSGLFDWQEVHRMNGIREVAYFIAWAFRPENRRRHEKHLLERYLHILADSGVGNETPSLADAFDQYRLMMIDAWTSVWASLALMTVEQEGLPEELLSRQYAVLEDLDVEQALRAAARTG
ncbi:phosphotransferase [Mycolicibacillus parakoreensis]|uniref:Phosphotransferase n=1 Tax=Mycolicibacillus parakoreensis TaxID=1069221 RepID=A0ABY3U2L3_9MYCO|nr:phosphotransferase [Mycolicibacillus parakoreensis]MCV7315266.1 phosphotransferase [Mycolicibacillus parakoreensis]ULN53404.1 phosphotransferase [Mycolicibacillus parakoreensis]